MMKIAVASGKGGTGKTFVSTHLYQRMVEEGLRVGMVDCDAEVPNDFLFLPGKTLKQWPVEVFCPSVDVDKCIYCGKCAEACHFHAITCIPSVRYIKVMNDLCHACTACLEVCEKGAILPGKKVVGEVTAYAQENTPHLFEARMKEKEHSPVTVIRRAIDEAVQVGLDYLILDAPPGCACPFVNTVKDADVVLLVTEPTPFGLSDLKHTVQVLRQLGKPFSVLVNRSDLGDGELKNYLKKENIQLLGEFPYSEQIASAYSKGELAMLTDLKLRQSFTDLMNNILKYESSCH